MLKLSLDLFNPPLPFPSLRLVINLLIWAKLSDCFCAPHIDAPDIKNEKAVIISSDAFDYYKYKIVVAKSPLFFFPTSCTRKIYIKSQRQIPTDSEEIFFNNLSTLNLLIQSRSTVYVYDNSNSSITATVLAMANQ